MFSFSNGNNHADRLRRALAEQEAEDAELRSILTDEGIPQAKINTIIASAMCRIRIAQVYQNHNSSLMAQQIQMINLRMAVALILLAANLLLGNNQLNLMAILTEIARSILR